MASPGSLPEPLAERQDRITSASSRSSRDEESAAMEAVAMEVIWDLLIFLALFAAGLVVLGLLARTH
jgi:hypothetical protein